eukprot:7317687-Prymnesium_polylepis.1
MWAVEQREQNHPGDQKCTDVLRDQFWVERKPCPTCEWGDEFFEETWQGAYCNSNWYEGDQGTHGDFFVDDAPALLGRDDDI